MPVSLRQSRFAAGELSPSLYGATDLPQYREGAKTLRNCIVTPEGSVMNRPGTLFCGQCKQTGFFTPPRLVPFVASPSSTYVLEFGHQYIRFWQNSVAVLFGGVPYEVATTYNANDLQYLKFCQVGNVLYLTCGAPANSNAGYVPQTLTYTSSTSWALANLAFDVPLPAYIAGGFAAGLFNADGTGISLNGPVSIGSTTAATQAPAPVAQPWQWQVTEVGVYPNGQIFESAPVGVTFIQTPVSSGAVAWDYAHTYAAGALVYVDLTGATYTSLQNGNTGENPYTTGGVWWSSTPGPVVSSSTISGLSNTGFILEQLTKPVARFWDPSVTYSNGAIVSLDGFNSGRWWIAINSPPTGADPLKYGTLGPGGTPNTNTVYWDGPHGPAVLKWTKTQSQAQTYNALGWNVYRGQNGTYGFLGFTTLPQFLDYGANPDYTHAPPQGRNPFKVFNYAGSLVRTENPGVVTVYQQRLVMAATPQRPNWFWAGQANNPTNFDNHLPGTDSDEYEFQIASQRFDQIRGAMGLDALFFTSDNGLWVASGQNGPITRANVQVTNQSTLGASYQDPLAIGEVGLYIRRLGVGVNEVIFDWRLNKWRANDLNALSRHLFNGHSLQDWTYAREPYSLIHATREDGVLLSLTYSSEQSPINENPLPQVKAWTWNDTGPQLTTPPLAGVPQPGANGQVKQTRDAFKTLCAVHEDGAGDSQTIGMTLPPEDVTYAVVTRTINGSLVNYVERFFTRQISFPVAGFSQAWPYFFLDSARVIQNPTVTPFVAVPHLAGETVTALADGNVVPGLVVDGLGRIDLSRAYPDWNANPPVRPQIVVVGLPYYSDVGTLDAAFSQQEVRAKQKTVSATVLEFANTRGIWAGEDFNNLFQFDQRQVSDNYGAVALATGYFRVFISGSYDYNGAAVIRQIDPLPFELLSIDRELQIGGGP